MLIEFDIDKLEKAIIDFYYATEMNISVFYEDFSLFGCKKNNNQYCGLVQNSGKGLKRCLDASKSLMEKCRMSQRSEYMICHAGLVEIVIPMLYEKHIVGYIMLGHVRESDTDVDIERALADLPIDIEIAKNIYISLPKFDKNKINGIINIAEMFVKFIIYENMLRLKKSYFDEAKHYIYNNIGSKLTSEKIAAGIHVSKSTLYAAIKEGTDLSVNEYVTSVRITRAKELLCESEISVNDISSMLGFSSISYFTRFFKKHAGMSPLAFRKIFEGKK